MTALFECFVEGYPAPKGSYRAVPNKRTGNAVLINDAVGGASWARTMAVMFRTAFTHAKPLDGPLQVGLTFWLRRGVTVKRRYPTVKPDLDKLQRNCLDALVTAGVLRDDALVVAIAAVKCYADDVRGPGVAVAVWDVEEE